MLSTLKKINFLITKRQRKGLVILTLLLFVGMVFEVFGLGILIPTLSIILDPEVLDKTPVLSIIRNYFSELSDKNFTYLFLTFIVFVYFFKSLFIVFLTFKQNRFLSNLIAHISNRLFSSYMSQPYRFHLNRNASELIKNIQVEINYLYNFLLSLITIIIEGGFIVAILLTLVYIEPVGAISIGIFYGILSVVFLRFTKRKLNIWGKTRQNIDAQLSKTALEGLGGIKDLLILGKVPFYIDNFSNKNYLKARLNSNQGTVSQIPRFYLEFISILGLVSFIILLFIQGKDTNSLITILGVFVAATFRMIPSLNRIIAGSQSIKYYMSSLNIIYSEINLFDKLNIQETSITNFSFKNKIELNKLHFGFTEGELVLEDINLTIKHGQTVGLIGESGCGKSTLVDLIIGLHEPTSGKISIDEIDNLQMNQTWRNNIGYVSQTIYLIDDSIAKNIALGLPENKINYLKINEVLKQVQLEKFINTLELGINTKVGERGVQLSGGQRQRIGIARALYNDPSILILDEATSALDTKTEVEVMKSVNNLKKGKTIIIVAHRLSTIDNCDVVLEIKNKSISQKRIG